MFSVTFSFLFLWLCDFCGVLRKTSSFRHAQIGRKSLMWFDWTRSTILNNNSSCGAGARSYSAPAVRIELQPSCSTANCSVCNAACWPKDWSSCDTSLKPKSTFCGLFLWKMQYFWGLLWPKLGSNPRPSGHPSSTEGTNMCFFSHLESFYYFQKNISNFYVLWLSLHICFKAFYLIIKK